MPMHCSVNVGANDDSAIFFGLSGTGKTTLSADPNRTLIGDDEHGWCPNGLFNFEGGCYAKMIRLSADAEPEIFATTKRFGTVLEKVVMDPLTRELDLDDATLAENSRGAYPIHYIPNASLDGRTVHPKNINMLTCGRLWRHAANRKTVSGAGDVHVPVRLHRESCGHGKRRHRAPSDFFNLFWSPIHAAPSV